MDFTYEETLVGGIVTSTQITMCRFGMTNVCCSSCTVGTGDTTLTVL